VKSDPEKDEIIRRLRLGDLRKLLRSRCGHTLPDDDAGREYLYELLLPISLGPKAATLKMTNAVEVHAPWMGHDEAEQLIDQINRTPIRERKPTGRKIGQRLRVTNEERELWKLWTIAPCDMTGEQLKEHRKAKKRARDRARNRRRRQGLQRRKVYLAANSLSRTKPWEADGISRPTWYRRRGNGRETSLSPIARGRETSLSPTKASLRLSDTPVSPEKPNRRKRLSEHRRLH
jgi:hypothetical protein